MAIVLDSEGVEVATQSAAISGEIGVAGVRGSGFTIVHMGAGSRMSFTSESGSMASELRITRKCVFSDGVMVTVLGSSVLSFLAI